MKKEKKSWDEVYEPLVTKKEEQYRRKLRKMSFENSFYVDLGELKDRENYERV